jgi:uncharacterized protein (DUF697 family)
MKGGYKMTEATKKREKIQRTRKRVYETIEPANVPEMSGEAAEILIEEPTLPPLDGNVEAVEQPAEVIVDPDADKRTKALATVRNYTLLSAGVGVVPIPLLDLATMLALQMLLVRKLASLYNIPYAGQRLKAAVAGLIGGFEGGFFGGYALKMIPLLGIFSYAVMPTINAAVCYAVGKVFIQHFESGGTFLDFDPKKVRAYFEDQFREGKLKAL